MKNIHYNKPRTIKGGPTVTDVLLKDGFDPQDRRIIGQVWKTQRGSWSYSTDLDSTESLLCSALPTRSAAAAMLLQRATA